MPSQKRELVFIDDFVKILIELTKTCENDIVNIGAGEEFTIRHFAQLICKQIGYDFNRIHFDTTKYVGAKSKCLNTDKLKNLLPNLQLTSLEIGLNQTIDWFWSEQGKLFPEPN